MKSNKIKEEILEKVKEYYLQKEDEKEDSGKISYAGRIYNQDELLNLIDASLNFFLTHSIYCDAFEKELGNYLGLSYVNFVNSGSSANLLAFMALTSHLLPETNIVSKGRVYKGDQVITTACCFPTTVTPMLQFGAVPVFVDIDINNLNIKTESLKYALDYRTKAIMTAHTLGNPFDIDRVKSFCIEHNLWMIEDNADALGSKWVGGNTGTFGDIGTSSFYPPHHITTGEGGAVYTNNPLLNKIIKSLRDWGRDCDCASSQDNKCGKRFEQQHGTLPNGFDHKYVYSHLGYNLKATEMQGAIGLAQLQKLEEFIQKRKDNFAILYKGLKCLEGDIILPQATFNSDPSWFGFSMIIRDPNRYSRNDLAKFLEDSGIQTRNLFAGNIIKQPFFESLEVNKDYKIIEDLKNTNKVMNDLLWIGVYPGLTEQNLEYMIKKVKEYFKK